MKTERDKDSEWVEVQECAGYGDRFDGHNYTSVLRKKSEINNSTESHTLRDILSITGIMGVVYALSYWATYYIHH